MSDGDPIKVLVQIRDLLRTMLDGAVYEARLAPGGKKGMEDCESTHLGHVITDVIVPAPGLADANTLLAREKAMHFPEPAKQTKQNYQSYSRKSGEFDTVNEPRSMPAYRQLTWSPSDE
jgi:hypothetical protein